MINTWWATRPKRDLRGVAPILSVVATHAEGRKWKQPGKATELAIEEGLEDAGLKRRGARRDKGGGGARTYRAWLKSLGLIFMDSDDRMWTTLAGDAILQGEPPLPVMKKVVLATQFPSAFTAKGLSAVDPRFRVRPFVFLLQLLADDRLGGYLSEAEDIAKIVICFAESNEQRYVDDVVERILRHRRDGDNSLPTDYLERFRPPRSKSTSLEPVFANFRDIANTFGNQISFTQLVTVKPGGRWEITPGAEAEVTAVITEMTKQPLIRDASDEEKFQRRFGLPPGKSKDTRNLDQTARNITAATIAEQKITTAFLALSSQRIITQITSDLVEEIAETTGERAHTVDRVLARKFPAGGIDTFMTEYAVMAFASRDRATEFEKATAAIFSEVFGFTVKHMGQEGIRPDVVISSQQEQFAAIIDAKAYKGSYSATHDHRNRMIKYVDTYSQYKIDGNPLEFFSYVVSEYKPTITGQIEEIHRETGTPGSAITARDIIRMVERTKSKPYTHRELRRIFSTNKGLSFSDIGVERTGPV